MTDEDANKILPTINDELLNDNEEELMKMTHQTELIVKTGISN